MTKAKQSFNQKYHTIHKIYYSIIHLWNIYVGKIPINGYEFEEYQV